MLKKESYTSAPHWVFVTCFRAIFTFTFTLLVEIDARVLRSAQKQNGVSLQQRVSGDVCCPIEAVAER